MKHLIKRPRDFWSGVMFAGVGSLFAGIGYTYKLGTAARMGPGFFPFYLGLMLVFVGVLILLASLRGAEGHKVDKFHWGPLFWVLSSICVFGVLLKLTGALVGGVALVFGASLGSGEFKMREVVWLAIGLSIFCAVIFVGGLKLPIPMCPGFEFFEQFSLCRV
ncbi:MAG: tripartite tricarboxylate transporter TctB family protein [Betaproteobacteria bacterium]|nr:tripartite tricarboxylate transporter TctB family protein [Betaproteobacteria bacterium]